MAISQNLRLETSKRLDSWDVKASCLHGYEGTAKVTKCEKPLTPYTLEGCSPIKCAMAVHKAGVVAHEV